MEYHTLVRLRNVARRWSNAISLQDHTIILSPFLTSPTAETVLRSADPENVEIYTLFEALNFISGASSIRTLRKLTEMGYQLYHLPKLHAKLVFVPGSWAALGSQNVTSQGTRNREATGIITDPAVLRDLKRQLEVWLTDRVPVTLQMIAEMEDRIKPLVKEFKSLARSSAEIDAMIQQRMEEERLANDRLQKMLHEMQRSVAKLPKMSSPRWGVVDIMSTGQWGSSSTYSLRPEARGDWTQWNSGGDRVKLLRTYRYLVLKEGSGKLGWARIAQTRITFVANSISWNNPDLIEGVLCNLAFKAVWDDRKLSKANLVITLTVPGETEEIDIHAWFTVGGLNIASIDLRQPSRSQRIERLVQSIHKNEDNVKLVLVKNLLKPFKYRRKLSGVQAHEFFGPVGSLHRLRMAKAKGSPLLIVSR